MQVLVVCLELVIGAWGRCQLPDQNEEQLQCWMGMLEGRQNRNEECIVKTMCSMHNSSMGVENVCIYRSREKCSFFVGEQSALSFGCCLLTEKGNLSSSTICNWGFCILRNSSLMSSSCYSLSNSVVEMQKASSCVQIENCEWRNIAFCGKGSILRNGEGFSEVVKKCTFANVTEMNKADEKMKSEDSITESHMEDSIVMSSMNVLKGGIASGTQGSGVFLCSNCTFHRNERRDWRIRNTDRLPTTETQTFKNAEWIECSADCGGALYVHDNPNATLTVENSSFVKCKATSTRGGGIYVLNIGECTVKHSVFEECFCASSTDWGGAGVEISGICIQPYLENCLFEDCWSGNDGGGVGIYSTKTINTEDCILDCSFKNCSAHSSKNGGGGGYDCGVNEKIVLKNCLFLNCLCEYMGGGCCISLNEKIGNFLYFCYFHNNSASFGNDVVILSYDNKSQAFWCFSSRIDENRYYAGGDKSEWLPNNGGKCRFVSSKLTQSKAKDTYSCGLNESYACLTISHCLSQLIVGFVEEMKVLSGTVVEGKGVDIGEKTISLSGVSPSGSAIETKFEGSGLSLFCIGTGELTVSDLSVVHNSSVENNRRSRLFEIQGRGLMDVKRMNISMDAAHSEERSIQNSLVKVDGGELKMKDVRWLQTFSTTSAISLSQGSSVSFSLDNCTFSNIVRTTAGSSLISSGEGSFSITLEGCTIDGCGSEDSVFGGGIMIEVGNIGSLTMNGGFVKNCYASTTQGRGGGIGLKVKDTSAEFLISSAFEGNRAKWGSDIFVDSIDLGTTATSGKITSLTASNSTINKIRGFHNGDETIPIPLCVYLISLPEEVVASNVDAFDHSHCGYAEFPCLTLKHSLTRQEEEKKIVVDGMIAMEEELTFDSFKHTIQGNDENSGWKVIDECDGSGEGMITVNTNTNLRTLIFSIPSALPNHEIFFSSTSQSFSLEDCSLTFQGSQSALSYVFLSTTAGEVSVSSFVVLHLTIGNYPLINLDESNAAGTFTSMNIEDISSTTNSVLFGVENGASFSIKDSTLSVKASLQTDLQSGSIRVISTNSSKFLKLTNNTISGFKGIEGNGGAIECTLGRDCSLEIVGGMMRECEINGGNGGGLWVEMKEGSSFTVGNLTEADSAKTTSLNDENDLFGLTNCKAMQTAGGECGYGGGIYLHLDDEASSFILKEVLFSGCDAREGKEIFINANDLWSVIDRSSIGFGVDLNNLTKLNGFERSSLNEAFAIPLVLYLWNNFSGCGFVGGGSLSHDFSKCGFEEFPCCTISKAASVHFEGKKKDVALLEPFVFEEELSLTSNEWSIKGKMENVKCDVSDQKEGAQSGFIANAVPVSMTGIIFSLKRSLTFHESVFECCLGKLTLSKCGMEGGAEAISTVFVKAVGGIVEVIGFGCERGAKWGSSLFVVEGNAESVSSMNMTKSDFGEITFGDGCVVECHNGNIHEMSGCTFSSIVRSQGSGGCVSVSNNKDDNDGRDFKVEINDCSFEGCAVEGKGNEIGGGALFCEAFSKTSLVVSGCKFYCCTAPYGEGSVGYGGGIMLNLLSEMGETDFVISSPTFSSDKPNNAKFGKDLFVSSPSLISSIKNETLPFVKDRLEILTEDSMRGFDGGNKECAIPLIYFWKEIGTSVLVARGGNNVVVCGLLEYPCGSVDYGVKRGSDSEIESIVVQGTCDVRSEMSVSGVMLEGTDGESDKIQFVKEIEGNGNVVVECRGVVQFKEVGILIPTVFDNEASILIQSGFDAIKTSVVRCSIHMKDDAEGELAFVLISASKGIVSIEKTEITGFSTIHEIMSISTDCVTTMSDVNFEDIFLSGKSAIVMRESVVSSSGNENAEEVWNILFDKCTFMNVKHSVSNNPSMLCCDVSKEVRLKMENSTIDGCGSASSNEGGGVFFLLDEKGSLEMNHTNVTDCFCSNIGRGGGLFLKSQSVSQKALPFVLSNITFQGNVASKGRDVFVKCTDLDTQISEWQFLINFGEPFVKELAIWGCAADNYGDEEDLLRRVFVFRSEFIFVSSILGNNSDGKNCGEMKGACSSLNVGVSHIIPSDYSQLYVWNETRLTGSCSAESVTIKSMEANRNAEIKIWEINLGGEGVVKTSEFARLERVKFVFEGTGNIGCSCLMHQLSGSLILESVSFLIENRSEENSQILFDCSLVVVEDGLFEADRCGVGHLIFSKPVFQILSSERATFEDLSVSDVECKSSMFECGKCENVGISKLSATNISLQDRSLISFEAINSSLVFSLMQSSFSNIIKTSSGSCIICTTQPMTDFEMLNCSFRECTSELQKGSQVSVANANKIFLDSCVFVGNLIGNFEKTNNEMDEICRWNGSVIDFSSSSAVVRDTTISNSSKGGITLYGGAMNIKDGRFDNTNPFIQKYPSLRRNIICSDSASLTISSLKGGDGVMPNSSLWILDDGCSLEGIAGESESPFFVPKLEEASASENGCGTEIQFKGALLLPCDLSFRLILSAGDTDLIETYHFAEDGFVSETEAVGMVPSRNLSSIPDETEVSVMIVYGKRLSATDSFILKNRSDPKANGDERIVEGGKEGKSYWLLIVVVLVVILLIVLIISVIFIVRWKKVKNEAEDLREIVNDNIRKDPKAFEMVTMEMSPEEQWRRAEREAEKKNEERIKKRVYAKSLGHSESSEHLLSESGSTEYILGRDSDKIPEWALEKVEEEKDDVSRKRTPSPSISSASTTDTSDTESTFVRGEDLCPTTSSMSNLVDAMACSSPHEKLIVDLRDSLFMLLHGRNEKKEMAIGTLQEREQTAAQVLFWVANLALHSFSEMDNPLQSLANLSPHIVLFSEHMVICIVMHSDFSSDDDSDSSSISSSTVATSASDEEEEEDDSLPSSAFEDEDDNFKKECLRWKAPELQMNKKMGATEKSVAFSVGMMLWECLTLQIPFGEYEAEAAGQKIANGEMPNVGLVKDTPYLEFWRLCISWNEADRPSLSGMKRELIGHFPAGAVMVTLTDAICDSLRDEEEEEEEEEDGMSESISKEEGRKSRKYL